MNDYARALLALALWRLDAAHGELLDAWGATLHGAAIDVADSARLMDCLNTVGWCAHRAAVVVRDNPAGPMVDTADPSVNRIGGA